MSPQHIFTLLAVSGIGIFIGSFAAKRRARNKRRNTLLSASFPEEYVQFIKKYIPIYERLPEELKTQLQGFINVFLAEKKFVGCSGQEITDEVKVTIAAQACMLLLNRKTNFYPKLKTIYVYPHTYIAKGLQNDGGLIVDGKSVRLGESWQNGPVVLTWDSVTGGARNIEDGRNVVFHEFAHQLDQEDGDADGAPILENRSCYRSWAAVLSAEYERLCNKTHGRRRSVLNKYGATNPAEFFAVATEAFFEKPKQMNKKSPDLYKELKSYYQIDPMSWDTSN